MDGGSPSYINLEAGLDSSSSDMLVHVSQPTFQHNWQKFQGKFLPNSLRFEKNGWAAGWNVYNFIYSDERVDVTSVDIRRAHVTKNIGMLDKNEYQLVRQRWNSTVEVENFWWLDKKHILELGTQYLTVQRKTDELDDWNGDRFEIVYQALRRDILPPGVDAWLVPNGYDYAGVLPFITISKAGHLSMTVRMYNPRDGFKQIGTFGITIRNRRINDVLNDTTHSGVLAYFNSYSPIDAGSLLTQADWSATVTPDNLLILGCHYNNNFNQWAIVTDLVGAVHNCIQGYGYVGVHGDLTGGQIPSSFFNAAIGFSGTVQPLDVLGMAPGSDIDVDGVYEAGSTGVINNIVTRCVGTAEQQWYIMKRNYGIVSHLTYNRGGTFDMQLLPITNEFSACYRSPSYTSAMLADMIPQAFKLKDIFGTTYEGQGTFAKVLEFMEDLVFFDPMELLRDIGIDIPGAPSLPIGLLYVLAPRYGQFIYLQQTFGQYAYVHYNCIQKELEADFKNSNTLENKLKRESVKDTIGGYSKYLKDVDPSRTEHKTFDKQVFTQSGSVHHKGQAFISLLCVAFVSAVQTVEQKYKVNEDINLTSASDYGKQFVTNVMENVAGVLANSLWTQSHADLACSSRVVGIKSLDMFYSTSDNQRVWAGPGYVEHQMVADCIAQSSTDVQAEGRVLQVTWVIKELTMFMLWLAQWGLDTAYKAVKDQCDIQKHAESEAMGSGGNTGVPIALALLTAAQIIIFGLGAGVHVVTKFMDSFLDGLRAKGVQANITASISKHALSVEATHRYGQKHEVFMWPCFGAQSNTTYMDESVHAAIKTMYWPLALSVHKADKLGFIDKISAMPIDLGVPSYSSAVIPGVLDPDNIYHGLKGSVPFYEATCYGTHTARTLPTDMVKVEGVQSFLPKEPFKNENIGVDQPVFAPSMQHDYVIDKRWDLGMYCTYGGHAQWVSVKDTKLTDCYPSNIVVTDDFCGVACAYMAAEVKRGLSKEYMRPWAVTPNVLAFNCTGYNSILDDKLYHSFDGYSYRIVDMVGAPGMQKNRQTFLYAFQMNDRFKRSNIIAANELQGNFDGVPVFAIEAKDPLWTLVTCAAREKGLNATTPGAADDKDAVRYSIPIFTEHVSTLPAAIKTLTANTLAVFEGVTSLCTDLMDTAVEYKAPVSVDFTIMKRTYRITQDYICEIDVKDGISEARDIVPALGLTFIGSTPYEAYFYSKANRCYYVFNGSGLEKLSMMERFRDIQKGYWDFVNQEVVMPCLMTFKRLNPEVEDKDTETDNIIVPLLNRNQVAGELAPPITTIFNDRSWYKAVSLPAGFAYQGPNRVIINRSVFVEYMLDSLKSNFGKWKKLDREKYTTKREYPEKYVAVNQDVKGVDGWTYNPFMLVTSALGADESVDCMFEWVITFCWPIEMDLIYGVDNYAVINIMSETMTPGGKRQSRPTHVFLTKELFTRDGSYGYYSFRFQSRNGAGNRERLHIWSDQYIAISSLVCEVKPITSRRTEQLTQQLDMQGLKEL